MVWKVMDDEKVILLVEDNPDDIVLTERALKKSHLPARLVATRDGTEALDYLFCRGAFASRNPQDNPEVILLDLKLPRMGGIETLKQIRADERTRLLPVIILTSSVEEKDLRDSYESKANSYIRKPVNFDSFVQAVQQLGVYWLNLNCAPARTRAG